VLATSPKIISCISRTVSPSDRRERREVLAAYGSLRREGAGAEVGGHVVTGASARVEERGVTVAVDDQEPRVGELAGHGDRVLQRRGRVSGVADHPVRANLPVRRRKLLGGVINEYKQPHNRDREFPGQTNATSFGAVQGTGRPWCPASPV
jgi:hypothetical protein